MPIIPKNLHSQYELNTIQDKAVTESSLWLPWQLSYNSNNVCGCSLLSQGTSIANMNSIWPKTKELLRFHSDCHSNTVTIAMR